MAQRGMVHARLDRPAIATARDAAALFAPALAGSRFERLLVAHVDADRRLLDLIEMEAGDATAVALPIRAIVADALRLGADGVILAHNHPSGDPEVSDADRAATRALATTAAELGIALHDHLIFAGGECRSFRALGLL